MTDQELKLKKDEIELEKTKLYKELWLKRVDIAMDVLRLRNWNAGDNEGWKDAGSVNQELIEAAEAKLLEFLK